MVTAAPSLPPGLGGPGPVQAASGDLTLVTDAVYAIRPAEGRLAVTITIEARNRTTETRTRRFYFDHAFLAVQPGAVNPRLAGAPGARARISKRTSKSTLLRLDFGKRLYSGKSATLRLTFDLPGRGKAASPQVRVGSSLVTIPAWAFASNGARGSTVTVRFPSGWDVAVESGEMTRRDVAGMGGVVLESGPIESPLTWFAYVTAQRPATFGAQPLTIQVGDREADLVLQGWVDDPAWSKRMAALLRKTLPVLSAEIGLPWPAGEPVAIAESVSRDADAFAALFDPAARRIEVAYWADHGVVVHQASHVWFNGALLADRWANEGFATYYALRASKQVGEAAEPPPMTAEAEDAALPLDTWTGSTGTRTPADTYAYAASYRLATEVANRVGDDALRSVWSDAAARIGAYQPAGAGTATSPTLEDVAGPPGWRGLLDLLEERSGTDLVPLWRELVVTPEEAPLLDARAAARASYRRTLALAGDWQLPRVIRDALRAWDFRTAEALMADVRTVLAQRDAGSDLAASEGLRMPNVMQRLFQDGAIAEASARAESERTAILALRRAEEARSADDDFLSRIGMLGEDPDQDIARARNALEAGDLDTALDSAERARRAWTVAWEEGRRRALLAIAVLATLLVLGSAVVSNRRRARGAQALEAALGTAEPPAPGAGPTAR
jgi:hypothetical protein